MVAWCQVHGLVLVIYVFWICLNDIKLHLQAKGMCQRGIKRIAHPTHAAPHRSYLIQRGHCCTFRPRACQRTRLDQRTKLTFIAMPSAEHQAHQASFKSNIALYQRPPLNKQGKIKASFFVIYIVAQSFETCMIPWFPSIVSEKSESSIQYTWIWAEN